MKIAIISSYPPRYCGVAEFNQDLVQQFREIDKSILITAIALNQGDEIISDYPNEVVKQIRKNQLADYLIAADYINSTQAEVVCLQHEFGLFGGFAGKYALELIKRIKKPIICILHAVPMRSDTHKPISRAKFFKQAAPYVSKFIVTMPDISEKLLKYGVKQSQIEVIEHGAPDILSRHTSDLRKRLNLPQDRFLLLNFGLLRKSKGIKYIVEALKLLRDKQIKCSFVFVAGYSNSKDNKTYFDGIMALIKKYDLEGEYIILCKKYLEKKELYDYINACDIGVLPYTYMSHVSSGVLSFFVSALKPVITTKFAYATYLLSNKSAYFVATRNSKAIAKGITQLMNNSTLYMDIVKNLKPIKERISWHNKALQYLDILNEVKNKQADSQR